VNFIKVILELGMEVSGRARVSHMQGPKLISSTKNNNNNKKKKNQKKFGGYLRVETYTFCLLFQRWWAVGVV
jgi:hypothetical protein